LYEYEKKRKLEQEITKTDKRDRFLNSDRSDARAVLEEVFDKTTLLLVYRLLNKGIIDEIFGVINSGKESRVYRGLNAESQDIAIKIYLTTSKEFRKGMLTYIDGDPRFRLARRDSRSLIYLWAQKEYKNLQRAFAAEIRVPQPLHVEKNVLVMEFIGDENAAAPTIKEDPPTQPQEMYNTILQYIHRFYHIAKLVHGDLSEYNIMNFNEQPVVFDLAQSVAIQHPRANEFLERDITNINRFFNKLDIEIKQHQDILSWIIDEA
jgi:RIO kinase 1